MLELFVNEQLGVADDIDEQNMPDLELDLFLDLRSHARKLFRRKRSDDFLEARIAAEWVPVGVQTQMSIAHITRNSGRDGELLKCEVLLFSPSAGDRQVLDQ